jgi:hypothetical protein
MKRFATPTALGFALTAFAVLHTAPASAMGHTGSKAQTAETRTAAMERSAQTEKSVQAQLDELRKELAELKAQQTMAKAPVAAQ